MFFFFFSIQKIDSSYTSASARDIYALRIFVYRTVSLEEVVVKNWATLNCFLWVAFSRRIGNPLTPYRPYRDVVDCIRLSC